MATAPPEPRTGRRSAEGGNPEPSGPIRNPQSAIRNRLDPTPGSVTGAQISALHRAPGLRRIGGDRHAALQEMASEHFGVRSLKRLSKQQASDLLVLLGVKPLTSAPPKAPRKVRPPGVIKLAEPWHAERIRRIARVDLNWSDARLADWLDGYYGVREPEKLGTAKRAGEAILRLNSLIEWAQLAGWKQ